MGNGESKDVPKQALMVGLSKSGKTSFLYETYSLKRSENDYETRGFNYELVNTKGGKIGIWDVGGSDIMKIYWKYFYQSVRFEGVIFMIESSSDEALKKFEESEAFLFGRCGGRLEENPPELDKKLITFLVNEEELRGLPFAIFFNFENPKGDLKDEQIAAIVTHPVFKA